MFAEQSKTSTANLRTHLKTPFDSDRLQHLWIVVVGLDHELFTRSRFKIGVGMNSNSGFIVYILTTNRIIATSQAGATPHLSLMSHHTLSRISTQIRILFRNSFIVHMPVFEISGSQHVSTYKHPIHYFGIVIPMINGLA